MIKFDTQVQELKYRVLKEVAKSYMAGTLEQDILSIPKIISPGPKPTMRCCIYKERAIAAERVKLAIGGDKDDPNILEVIEPACDQCPIGGMEVSDACRGCLAHRCAGACHMKAISFDEHLRAHIDKSKCVNCGLCAKACPFGAIINHKRPCESACKIKAIHKREDGISEIDESKCTRCGACSYACPFGAIMDKSYILKCLDIAKESEEGKSHAYMVVAPSISSQFHYAKLGQVVTGIKKLGFHEVVEAALGADMVAYKESQELAERGQLTSSCCPAFVRYIKTSFPELSDKISSNLSPMAEIAKYIKETDSNAKVVFVGPCISKKMEMENEESKAYVDCVITFEELQALIDAKGIDLPSLEEKPLDNASYYGRIFARSGGLSDAVREALKEQGLDFDAKIKTVSGLDQCKIALMGYKNKTADYNFIEGMACTGGCIGGPCCLTHEMRDASDVDKYGHESKEKTIEGALNSVLIK
ncbi:MAG: 4Fe-4S dicluster domain-containing protein [Bacilli bacterium]|jgi:[FeFe] hydrogenase (group B1/B3)|nr:4Fe-4S dicluster domain-containing protein [Bacilli bacterium]MCH4210347.1 4Fe-4S dicluster domain-containing protein [Bacilli bacterium]MCH4228883.1 4Fe-4S dicluster domain-containing protein [Bacilli bacterium]MCH4277973.1 4Fe-4S dicluster domain-containing protein [Bacilli bacterium]MCI2054763.1 4Fe-4S dicluster domain-containing protein [Bacilli bacterium]